MLFEPSDLTEPLDGFGDQPLSVTAPLESYDLIFGPFMERSSVEIPPNYLQNAPGVLFAGPRMLKLAGCKPGVSCPDGWTNFKPGVWVRYMRPRESHTLQVRQSGNHRTKRWAVERIDGCTLELEALVFLLLDVPIWANSRREAIFLAEFYRSAQAARLVNCNWKQVLS
jgi:hypothetical protein